MVLAEYYAEYEKDPDFVAEGLALRIIDNALYVMQEQGVSESDLMATMGVSKAQVSRIFNAPPTLTLRSIARIALALGVPSQELLDVEAPARRAVARIAAEEAAEAAAAD